MGVLPSTLELLSVAEGATILAKYVELTRALAKAEIDSKWWNLPDVPRSKREQERDHSWSWVKAVGEHRNEKWY